MCVCVFMCVCFVVVVLVFSCLGCFFVFVFLFLGGPGLYVLPNRRLLPTTSEHQVNVSSE